MPCCDSIWEVLRRVRIEVPIDFEAMAKYAWLDVAVDAIQRHSA
jgi:hypothetical protein